MTQALIPLEYEIYLTPDNKKLFITLGYDQNTMVYYYIYSYEEDDIIAAGIDEEFLEYKKKEFVENRELKLIKRGEFKK